MTWLSLRTIHKSFRTSFCWPCSAVLGWLRIQQALNVFISGQRSSCLWLPEVARLLFDQASQSHDTVVTWCPCSDVISSQLCLPLEVPMSTAPEWHASRGACPRIVSPNPAQIETGLDPVAQLVSGYSGITWYCMEQHFPYISFYHTLRLSVYLFHLVMSLLLTSVTGLWTYQFMSLKLH